MTYESSFEIGEHQSFQDRRLGRRLPRPAQIKTEDEQGFWDGYLSRDPEWSKRDTCAHPILRLTPYTRQQES